MIVLAVGLSMMLVMQFVIDFYAQEIDARQKLEKAYVSKQVDMIAERMRMFEQIHWRYPSDLAELQSAYVADRNIHDQNHPWVRYRATSLSGGFDYSRGMVYAPNYAKSEDETDYEQSSCGFVSGDFANSDGFCLAGKAGDYAVLENRQHWLGRLSNVQQELYVALHKAADYYSANGGFPTDIGFANANWPVMQSGLGATVNGIADGIELEVANTGIVQSGAQVSVTRSFSLAP